MRSSWLWRNWALSKSFIPSASVSTCSFSRWNSPLNGSTFFTTACMHHDKVWTDVVEYTFICHQAALYHASKSGTTSVAFTCVPAIRLVHCAGAPCPTGMCWCLLSAASMVSSFSCRACNSLSMFTPDEALASRRTGEDFTFTEESTDASCWPAEKQKEEWSKMCRCVQDKSFWSICLMYTFTCAQVRLETAVLHGKALHFYVLTIG